MIKLELLSAFISVAENGGFTRAASELHRTQPTISMQIRRLEDILGVPLFLRNTTTIELSSEGAIFIGYARRILQLVDESLNAVLVAGRTQSIRLGCIEDYAARILPKILAEFWTAHPDVRIDVGTGETAQLLERLGVDYDMVLAMHPSGSGEGELVCTDSLVWATSTLQSPHQQMPLPVALRPEGCLERDWATIALNAAGRPWRCAYESIAIGTLQTAVEEGLAVGVFKLSTIGDHLRHLTEKDGFPDLPGVDIALHLASDGASQPGVIRFAEKMAEALRVREGAPTP